MDKSLIIDQTIGFVKRTLRKAEAGHDWLHIERVYRTAMKIHAIEGGDKFVIALAALLHDIADSKFHNGDEEIGPRKAGRFLKKIGVEDPIVRHVRQIIRNMSFRTSLGKVKFHSQELDIVQDADRLDAIGAIGIARAFNYGGHMNRAFYDPRIPFKEKMSKEEYKNSASPTINHFHEKLMKLRRLMKTETGKKLAGRRHNFMLLYLRHFHAEIDGRS